MTAPPPYTLATEWARQPVGRALCGPNTADARQARSNLTALSMSGNGVLAAERAAIPVLLQEVDAVEKGFQGNESAREFRVRVRSVAERLALGSFEDSQAVIERCLRQACAASPGGERCTRGGVPVPPPEAAPPPDAKAVADARARGEKMKAMVTGFGAASVTNATTIGRPGTSANSVMTGARTTTAARFSTHIDYGALNAQERSSSAQQARRLNVAVPAPGTTIGAATVVVPTARTASPHNLAANAGAAVATSSNSDLNSPKAKPSFARSSEDEISVMKKTFDATVARLVSEGKRTPGSSRQAALWNDIRAAHGGPNLLCYDQAHELLRDLAQAFGSRYDSGLSKENLYFYDSTGKWKFVFTTYTGEGHEADGHYWVTAISRVPADDTVVMDPWVGKFERTREKNPIAIKGFTAYWLGRALSWF
jgi:hypothetical protein